MQNFGSPSPSRSPSDELNDLVEAMQPLSFTDMPREMYHKIMRATDPRSQGRLQQTTRERYYDQIPAADSRLASAALHRESEERVRRSIGSISEVRIDLTATNPDFRVVYTGSFFIPGGGYHDYVRNLNCTLRRHNAFIRSGVHQIAPSDVFFENHKWGIGEDMDILWGLRISYVTRFGEFVGRNSEGGSGSDIDFEWGQHPTNSIDIVGVTQLGPTGQNIINSTIMFPYGGIYAGVNLTKTCRAELSFEYQGERIPLNHWHNLLEDEVQGAW